MMLLPLQFLSLLTMCFYADKNAVAPCLVGCTLFLWCAFMRKP